MTAITIHLADDEAQRLHALATQLETSAENLALDAVRARLDIAPGNEEALTDARTFMQTHAEAFRELAK